MLILSVCHVYVFSIHFVNQYYSSRTVEWRGGEGKRSVRVIGVWKSRYYASVKIYLSPVLLELLTIKESVDYVIYNEVAGIDLRTEPEFSFGTVAYIGFAVDVVETRRFQTPLATVVEFTRLQRVYNTEREL